MSYDLYMTDEPLALDAASGPAELPATEARSRWPELIDEVRDGGVVYLTRYGKRIAALVPADVAENYERIEDDYWARRAADAKASGGSPVPWGQAVAELEAPPDADEAPSGLR